MLLEYLDASRPLNIGYVRMLEVQAPRKVYSDGDVSRFFSPFLQRTYFIIVKA